MTTVKFIVALGISVTLLGPAVMGKERKCVLPAPDSRSAETSDPSVTGDIVNIQNGLLKLKASGNLIKVRIDDKTRIFTSFGGFVPKKKLRVGESLYVWYVGCDLKQAGSPPLAAVVEVRR